MEEWVLPSITAFVGSFISIKLVNPFAVHHGLVDVPNHRKYHEGAIPLVGGIGIFIGVLTALVIHLPASKIPTLYLISAALVVFLGTIDDKYDISSGYKLVGQVLAACIMVYGGDVYISDLGNLFGVGNVDLGYWAYPFTILAVLVAINAFNFIDGIDGLAGSMSIIAFSCISYMMIVNKVPQIESRLIPLLVVSSIVPYMVYNLGLMGKKLEKVFMGDAGSMFMGLSVVWMLAVTTQGEYRTFSPVTALWFIAIPLMDMGAIMLRRIKNGKSPFEPDRGHLHHVFLRAGYSDRQSLIIITCLSIALASVGILGELLHIPHYIMAIAFLGVFFVYNYALKYR